MPVSERKRAANQANAAKSTGPRTPRGKSQSSRNALKHGNFAKALLLDGESQPRFLELLRSYHEEFQPATPSQCDLVDNLALASWCQRRYQTVQAADLSHEMRTQAEAHPTPTGEPPSHATLSVLAFRELGDKHRHMDYIGRQEARYNRQFVRLHNQLLKITERSHGAPENKGSSPK